MGATHFSGPVLTGTKITGETGGPNQGYCQLSQFTSITQNSTSAVNATLYVPSGCRITSFDVDVLTAFDSAVSATLTIGTSSGATTYVSGVNAKTAGRASISYTAAQLAAMAGQTVTGTSSPVGTTIVATVTPSGATTAGYVVITVNYVQI